MGWVGEVFRGVHFPAVLRIAHHRPPPVLFARILGSPGPPNHQQLVQILLVLQQGHRQHIVVVVRPNVLQLGLW